MKAAVIGIGSNSVRMLLAQLDGQTGKRICRERAGTRLFAGLDEHKRLSAEAMAVTVEAVKNMTALAREKGAEEIWLFATSATRDASNQEEFSRCLREETGLELEICSGDEEAALSFLGATGGGDCGVIDIGGGSTEFVTGMGREIRCAFSCQMGAVRLSQRLPITSHEDLAPVRKLAEEILTDNLQEHPEMELPEKWIGTGGTFTTLAAMVRGVHWTNRTYMHGTVLSREAVEKQALVLADMDVEARKTIPGLQPNRADIIVHGICILLAAMEKLDISEITVSEYGNLDGYVKDRYGILGEISP